MTIPAAPDRGAADVAELYWAQHAAAVTVAIRPWGDRVPLVFVGHSAAGPLLPAIRILVAEGIIVALPLS